MIADYSFTPARSMEFDHYYSQHRRHGFHNYVHKLDGTVIHKTGSTNVLHLRCHYDRQRERKFRF